MVKNIFLEFQSKIELLVIFKVLVVFQFQIALKLWMVKFYVLIHHMNL